MIVFPPPHWLHPPSFPRPEAHIQSSGNPSENNNSHCSLHSFISLHAEKIYLNLDDCPCLLEFLRAGTGREQWLGWLGLTYELEPELQLLKMFLPLEHRLQQRGRWRKGRRGGKLEVAGRRTRKEERRLLRPVTLLPPPEGCKPAKRSGTSASTTPGSSPTILPSSTI